jgi:hypothetical protein
MTGSVVLSKHCWAPPRVEWKPESVACAVWTWTNMASTNSPLHVFDPELVVTAVHVCVPLPVQLSDIDKLHGVAATIGKAISAAIAETMSARDMRLGLLKEQLF